MRAIAASVLLTLTFFAGSTAAAQAPASDAGSITDQAREALSHGDRDSAVKLTELACEAGEAAGCTLRGNIEPDPARRAEFFDRGCAKGDGTGCFTLQSAYQWGIGVKKDGKRAKQLADRSLVLSDSACTAGDPYSCMTAGGIYAIDKKTASAMGASWQQDLARSKAAYDKGVGEVRMRCDAGSSFDCFAFAVAVTMGTGIETDPVGGAALLQASCDGGFANACTMLGMSLVMGTGALPKDPARANALLERGCDGGDWGACQFKTSLGGAMTLGAQRPTQPGQNASGAAANAPKRKFRTFRSVAGAAATYMAAKSVGASPDEALGAAAKATEMLNPDSEFAKQLGDVGEGMIQRGLENRLANAAAKANDPGSGSGAGGAGGAKFRVKEMFAGLAQACGRTGVNFENFENASFAPGGDVQLKTMCGQAFNYFKMYKNAVRQGYAEADCNRTYAAHAGAARVAIDYASRG